MSGKVIYIGEKKTMASAKLIWFLANTIGIPLTVLGFIINIDNIKSSLIFLVVLGFWLTKWYFTWKEKKQSLREKEIDIRDKEIALWWKEQEKLKAEAKTVKSQK